MNIEYTTAMKGTLTVVTRKNPKLEETDDFVICKINYNYRGTHDFSSRQPRPDTVYILNFTVEPRVYQRICASIYHFYLLHAESDE